MKRGAACSSGRSVERLGLREPTHAVYSVGRARRRTIALWYYYVGSHPTSYQKRVGCRAVLLIQPAKVSHPPFLYSVSFRSSRVQEKRGGEAHSAGAPGSRPRMLGRLRPHKGARAGDSSREKKSALTRLLTLPFGIREPYNCVGRSGAVLRSA